MSYQQNKQIEEYFLQRVLPTDYNLQKLCALFPTLDEPIEEFVPTPHAVDVREKIDAFVNACTRWQVQTKCKEITAAKKVGMTVGSFALRIPFLDHRYKSEYERIVLGLMDEVVFIVGLFERRELRESSEYYKSIYATTGARIREALVGVTRVDFDTFPPITYGDGPNGEQIVKQRIVSVPLQYIVQVRK